jgi:two-component system cell cycle sensor histidine kinase/response regulator CckA
VVTIPEPDTILLVENNEVTRDVRMRALLPAGYIVLSASDVDDAIATLEHYVGAIDLVVADDVTRPGGRQLLKRTEAIRPGTPVLFTSGEGLTGRVRDVLGASRPAAPKG